MLKNKPWQIWAMLAVHSITLGYIIFMLVHWTIQYPSAGFNYAASAVLGGFSLFFLFRGNLIGLVLEAVYLLSFFYFGFHFADVLAVIVLTAVFALQKPAREFFRADFKAQIKRTVIISSIAIAAAILSAVFWYNIDRLFYLTHSKADLNKITAYITETYGSDAELDKSHYKSQGDVFVVTNSGEWGTVSIRNNAIFDGIVVDKMQQQYEEKINKGLEYHRYHIYIYRWPIEDTHKLRANINIADFLSQETELYDESSIDRVYQMFLQLIDDGFEVSISPSFGLGFSQFSIAATRSLLFPFLNSDLAEYTAPPPSSIEFTEKCSIEEFTKRINENITETQAYRDMHSNETVYQASYGYNRVRTISIAVTLLIILPFYLLQSVALFVMTTRRGLSKPWIAWIPQISQYSLAKISDDTDEFHGCGKTLAKRTLVLFALTAAAILMRFAVGTQDSLTNVFSAVVSIAATVTLLQSAFRVYDAYLPQNVTSRKILSFFFPAFAIPIILFMIRNKNPVQNHKNPPDITYEKETGPNDTQGE